MKSNKKKVSSFLKKINFYHIIVLLFFVIVIFGYGSISFEKQYVIGGDGLGYYAHLRSPLIDGDFDYENEFRDYNPLKHTVENHQIKTETGHVKNRYAIGQAILWLPFFLLGHTFTYFLNLVGFNLPLDGYSFFYHFFIGLGTISYGLIGLYLIFKICKKFFEEKIIVLSIILFVLASNVIYYFVCEPSMSHINSMFMVSCFIYYWLITYKKRALKQYFYIGLISGLMVLVRYQVGLFLILLFYEAIEKIIGDRDRLKRLEKEILNNLIAFAGFIIIMIPQFIVWKIIYGHFIVFSYSGTMPGLRLFKPHLIEILLSSKHGLISWTPVVFFCLLGLLFFIKKNKKIGLYFTSLFLMQLYFNSTYDGWSAGHAFGARKFVSCSLIFIIGLAALLEKFKKKKAYFYVLLAIVAILVIWNFIMIQEYYLGLISHGDYINFLDVIKNIPKL